MKSELLNALKKACFVEAAYYIKEPDCYRLDNDKNAVNVGAMTPAISKLLSDEHHTISTKKVRYHLKKLEKAGLVISIATTGGYTRWWPVGLAEELREKHNGV